MDQPSTPHAAQPTVRDGWRDVSGPTCGPPTTANPRQCPVCSASLPSTRARYCSAACRQRAYRGRHPGQAEAGTVSRRYRHTAEGGVLVFTAQRTVTQTVYACPLCEARLLGEQRCSDCNRFCRVLGLGGACPECDQPVLIAELLGLEVTR